MFSQIVNTQIVGDAVQPGGEFRLVGLPAAGIDPESQKRFLGNVLGVFVVAE